MVLVSPGVSSCVDPQFAGRAALTRGQRNLRGVAPWQTPPEFSTSVHGTDADEAAAVALDDDGVAPESTSAHETAVASSAAAHRLHNVLSMGVLSCLLTASARPSERRPSSTCRGKHPTPANRQRMTRAS
jgi:hypothetical protein